ncbi:hypothetical protein [Nannocystis exedens]|nr:hypothetical protein [Nannocystis exedens]
MAGDNTSVAQMQSCAPERLIFLDDPARKPWARPGEVDHRPTW